MKQDTDHAWNGGIQAKTEPKKAKTSLVPVCRVCAALGGVGRHGSPFGRVEYIEVN